MLKGPKTKKRKSGKKIFKILEHICYKHNCFHKNLIKGNENIRTIQPNEQKNIFLTDPISNLVLHDNIIIIYGVPTSRVVKVLWACAECNVNVIHVPIWQERFLPWFLSLNNKHTVPVMRHKKLILNESNTIVSYIAQTFGKQSHFYPSSRENIALAWQWAEWGESTLEPALNNLFFGLVRKIYHPSWKMKKGQPKYAELKPFVKHAQNVLIYLNHYLNHKHSFLLDDFTFADITSGVHMNRFFQNNKQFADAFPVLDGKHYPHIRKWWKILCSRKALKNITIQFSS